MAGSRAQSMWAIFRIHHQRTRYIYDQFYRKKSMEKKHENCYYTFFFSAISRDVYDYCLRERYADANLIAKWKKVVDFFLFSGFSLVFDSPVMKNCVVFVAFKQLVRILALLVFVEFHEQNWRFCFFF